jgi:hypothetical protein
MLLPVAERDSKSTWLMEMLVATIVALIIFALGMKPSH